MKNNKWITDAEMAMQGFPIAVESDDHLQGLVAYCYKVLKGCDDYDRVLEILDNARNKYNSDRKKGITFFVVNDSPFGVMFTFVRGAKALTLKSGKMKSSGIFSWVENIDNPDCSEAGYTYFENRHGKTVRIG